MATHITTADESPRAVLARARRLKAGLDTARKLDAAVKAMNTYMHWCNTFQDGSEVRREDDGRVLLVQSMAEFSTFLTSVYDKP